MGSIRIALVDCDPENICRFSRVIRRTGYTYILSVYSDSLAPLCEITERNMPDIIVIDWFLPARPTDWFLPVLDAPAFVAELRSIAGLERLTVVVLLPADWPEGQQDGFESFLFLKKPIGETQMKNLIALASEQASSR